MNINSTGEFKRQQQQKRPCDECDCSCVTRAVRIGLTKVKLVSYLRNAQLSGSQKRFV